MAGGPASVVRVRPGCVRGPGRSGVHDAGRCCVRPRPGPGLARAAARGRAGVAPPGGDMAERGRAGSRPCRPRLAGRGGPGTRAHRPAAGRWRRDRGTRGRRCGHALGGRALAGGPGGPHDRRGARVGRGRRCRLRDRRAARAVEHGGRLAGGTDPPAALRRRADRGGPACAPGVPWQHRRSRDGRARRRGLDRHGHRDLAMVRGPVVGDRLGPDLRRGRDGDRRCRRRLGLRPDRDARGSAPRRGPVRRAVLGRPGWRADGAPRQRRRDRRGPDRWGGGPLRVDPTARATVR